MPNWCFTNVKIEGSKEMIARIAKEFEKVTARAFAEEVFVRMYPNKEDRKYPGDKDDSRTMTDFGEGWLGNLTFYAHGSLPDGIHSRGRVYMGEESETSLVFEIESAWSSHLEPLVDFMEAAAGRPFSKSGISLLYAAEEPGEGYFLSNDPDIVGRVYNSSFSDNMETPEELLSLVNERYHASYASLDEARAEMEGFYFDGPFDNVSWEELMDLGPEERTASITTTGKAFREEAFAKEKENDEMER